MATLIAHLKIRAGEEARFEAVARELYAATHAREPGCRRYEYFRGAEPGRYYCLLSFDDFVAFLGHQASEHHEAPDYASMLEDVRLEWVDPVQGAAPLVQTDSAALPAGASQLMKAYAVRCAAELQSWWSKLR